MKLGRYKVRILGILYTLLYLDFIKVVIIVFLNSSLAEREDEEKKGYKYLVDDSYICFY